MFECSLDQASGLRQLFGKPLDSIVHVVPVIEPGMARAILRSLVSAVSRSGHSAAVDEDQVPWQSEPPATPPFDDRTPVGGDRAATHRFVVSSAGRLEVHRLGAGAEVLIVGPAEPLSLPAIYAEIKRIGRVEGVHRFSVLLGPAADEALAERCRRNLGDAAARFLRASLDDWGVIPGLDAMKRAERMDSCVYTVAEADRTVEFFDGLAARITAASRRHPRRGIRH